MKTTYTIPYLYTLIDIFPRPGKVDSTYARKAVQCYGDDEVIDVSDVFEEKYLYWTEEPLKSLLTSLTGNLRKYF